MSETPVESVKDLPLEDVKVAADNAMKQVLDGKPEETAATLTAVIDGVAAMKAAIAYAFSQGESAVVELCRKYERPNQE